MGLFSRNDEKQQTRQSRRDERQEMRHLRQEERRNKSEGMAYGSYVDQQSSQDLTHNLQKKLGTVFTVSDDDFAAKIDEIISANSSVNGVSTFEIPEVDGAKIKMVTDLDYGNKNDIFAIDMDSFREDNRTRDYAPAQQLNDEEPKLKDITEQWRESWQKSTSFEPKAEPETKDESLTTQSEQSKWQGIPFESTGAEKKDVLEPWRKSWWETTRSNLLDPSIDKDKAYEAEREYRGVALHNNASDDMVVDIDLEKAMVYLRNRAYPRYIQGKCGYCATAVRKSLEAGGVSTVGHPEFAKDYDSFLPKIGYRKVDPNNYTPRCGDIIVHEAQTGHPHGHIAMYDGKIWISDFVQSNMFGGDAYRINQNYTLWRP